MQYFFPVWFSGLDCFLGLMVNRLIYWHFKGVCRVFCSWKKGFFRYKTRRPSFSTTKMVAGIWAGRWHVTCLFFFLKQIRTGIMFSSHFKKIAAQMRGPKLFNFWYFFMFFFLINTFFYAFLKYFLSFF
jgi:hypothetical protein